MFSPVTSLTRMAVEAMSGQYVYFVSDVHLGFGSRERDREREALLLRLLDRMSSNAAHLFIVGDLFDYWFDYRTVIPRGHVRTLAALAGLRERGLPITYLMGNHDFGHFTYFHEELGITVVTGDVHADIAGSRFYIAHGDGKAHNDKGYLILRSILRNRFAQRIYRMLHPNLGIGLAARTSHGSRDYTTARDYGPVDGIRDFAIEKIHEGYDVVVMGHRHRAMEERRPDGTYVNLGDWLGNDPTFGIFDPATRNMSLGSVHEYLQSGLVYIAPQQ